MLATQQSIKAYVDANAGSMSNAQVRAAVEAATDSNVFTDADHSKLNGIEASATADQTAAQILTAIKTVDGSGSGLDADTLDGVQGASYLRSDAADTVTEIINFNTATGTKPLRVSRLGSSSNQYCDIYIDDSYTNFKHVGDENGEGRFRFYGDPADASATVLLAFDMSTVTYKGNTVWHAGNDGSGSGLDADVLDGIGSGSFLRSDVDDTVNAYTTQITFPSNTNAATASGDQASLQVQQTTGNADAFMTFHVSGDFATYFGLDGTTNDLFVGGWSNGTNKYKIWHQNNDGAGSGLDADTLDGVQGSSYLRSDASDTFTGTLTVAGSLDVNGSADFVDNIEIQSTTGYAYMEMGGPSGAFIDLKKPFSDDYDFRIMHDGTSQLTTTGNSIKINTASGNVFVGPQNSSYCHFSTDRAKFYFNKQIVVDEGIFASYDEDIQLLPGNSAQSAYIKIVNGAGQANGTYQYFVDNNADQSTYAHTMYSSQSGSQTTTADRLHTNLFVNTDVTATGGGTDHEHRPIGIYNDMDITGTNTDPDLIWGVYNYITLSQVGTGTTGAAYGDYNQVYLNHENSNQLVSNATGTYSRIYHANAAGTSTNTYASYNHNFYHSSANADTSASYGVYSEVESNRNITYPNFISYLAVIDRNDGTISNGYMYKADYQGTLPTNAWGMYVEGDKHYLQGRVGINTTSPSSSYALDVNGDIVCDKIVIEGTADASLSSTTHAFQVGPSSGVNTRLDGNEIMTISNGNTSTLYMQNDGGNVSFAGDVLVADQIMHVGDTNTYMQFHAADQFRVVTGGTERLEVNNSAVTVAGVLSVGAAIDLIDNKIIRFGSSDDVEFFFSGSHMYTDLNTGDWYIRDGTTNRFLFNDNGDFHADANIFAYSTSVGSDRKLKDNIEVIESPLEKIQKLNGVTFNWKRDGEASAGVIAQDVQKVLPSAVKEVKQLSNEGEDSTRLNVDYNQIIGLLVESVKELKKEIEELKKGK